MAITQKLFSAFLFICLARQAWGQSSCISVAVSKTGAVVEGNPEYRVTISNNCACGQSQVVVKCFGLSSYEAVDPNAIKVLDAEKCIVNNGNPIAKGSPITFKFAWLTPQDFPVLSSKGC